MGFEPVTSAIPAMDVMSPVIFLELNCGRSTSRWARL